MRTNDDGAFAARVEEQLSKGPAGRRLRADALTKLPWKTLCLFPEGARHDLINETLGTELLPAGGMYRDRRHLVIFTGEGNPIVTQVSPLAISAGSLCYGPDAEFEVFGTDPGPYRLRLTEAP